MRAKALLGALIAAHLVPSVAAIGPLRRAVLPRLCGVSDRDHVALTFDDGPDLASTPQVLGLLAAGDPHGEVRMAWHAKEVLRSIYDIPDPDVAAEFVTQLGHDLQDDSCPVEVRSLGRTILRWKDQISAWHQARFTNAPTEAANNLIKRVKRIAFGFTRFRNYRVRVLLYAGRPNWALLATATLR